MDFHNDYKRLYLVFNDKIDKIEKILNMLNKLNKKNKEKFNYLLDQNAEMNSKLDKCLVNDYKDHLKNNSFSSYNNRKNYENKKTFDLLNQSHNDINNQKLFDEICEDSKVAKGFNESYFQDKSKKFFIFKIKKIIKS
jgi:hypothetical protein